MRIRRRKRSAPSLIIYATARNPEGHDQPCVYAECLASNARVGPVWGQHQASVKRSLAMLADVCECGRRFHAAREFAGYKIKRN